MLLDALIFIAGVFAWTIVEYVIHGVLGHAHRTFVTGLHEAHHRDPRAVFALGAWIPTAVVLIGALAWFGWAPGVIFYGGIGADSPSMSTFTTGFISQGRRARLRSGCARGIWRIIRASRMRSSE